MIADPSHHNVVNLTLYVDVHIIDSDHLDVVELHRLADSDWIALNRTDTLDTELGTAEPAKRRRLAELSGAYPESYGPMVPGESEPDRSVTASPQDTARLAAVSAILFPNLPDLGSARRNHRRDAMHVATAIRYGGHAFITTEKRPLNKDAAIRDAFNGFRMWHPRDAVAETRRRIDTERALRAAQPHRGPLPLYPPT